MDHICKVLQTGRRPRLGRQGQQHRGRDLPECSGRWSLQGDRRAVSRGSPS